MSAASDAAFPDLSAAYAWLERQINYEHTLGSIAYDARVFAVDDFRRRLGQLGDPQRGLRTVHIAGSRGKGSAASAIAALLRASGLRTALYTSPHLYEYRERIDIDGQPLSAADFRALLGRIAALQAAEGADAGEAASEAGSGPAIPEIRPVRRETGFKTVFEHLTALFLLAARESAVDWAVVETGLGGRLDATNALDPGPVLLTRIGLEHTQLLGDTLELIAAEKAAILKPGGWAVAGAQEPPPDGGTPAAAAVFARRAAETGAPLAWAAELCPLRELTPHAGGLTMEFGFEGQPLRLDLPSYGPFQAENLQNALALFSELRRRALVPRVPVADLAAALASLHIPGRMERLATRPELLIDGGHCPTAAAALARTMHAHFGSEPAALVIGMMAEKDHAAIFRALAAWPHWTRVVCYRPPSPRAMDPHALAVIARQFLPGVASVEVQPHLEDILENLDRYADKSRRVVATGSLYSIATLLSWGKSHGAGGADQATA